MRRRYCRKHINASRSKPLRLTFILLLFAAVSVPPLFAQWYNAAWTSRQQITIKSSTGTYGLTTDLPKFPYLVSLGAGNDVFAKAQASGNDILFTASDGVTKIPHEIENYSNSTPNLTAWVQLPVFTHGTDTVIYMYYGNPGAANQQQPTQVWDSSYGSVWHLKETGTAGTYADSTSNANAGLGGTVTVNNAPTRTAGTMVAGYGQTFNKADPDFIRVPGQMGQPSSATISAWVNLTSADTNGSEVLSVGDSLLLRLDATGGLAGVRGSFYNGSAYQQCNTGVSVAGTGLRLVTYRVDTSTQQSYVYINGVLAGTASITGSPTYTNGPDTYIGKHGNGQVGYAFNGTMDEVRFSSVSRSSDWIITDYQSQLPSAQGAPATGTVDITRFIKQRNSQLLYFQYKVPVTINGSLVVGTQTNFPVLVHVTLPSGHVANANGYDTMFTDANGVPLADEIVGYNAGDFWAWVKVPTLVSGADTTVYLYYGNANITTPPNASAVWDSNFAMVQHLNTSPAATLTDSTSNGNNGTSSGGMNAASLVAGQIWKGIHFNGSQFISVAHHKPDHRIDRVRLGQPSHPKQQPEDLFEHGRRKQARVQPGGGERGSRAVSGGV